MWVFASVYIVCMRFFFSLIFSSLDLFRSNFYWFLCCSLLFLKTILGVGCFLLQHLFTSEHNVARWYQGYRNIVLLDYFFSFFHCCCCYFVCYVSSSLALFLQNELYTAVCLFVCLFRRTTYSFHRVHGHLMFGCVCLKSQIHANKLREKLDATMKLETFWKHVISLVRFVFISRLAFLLPFTDWSLSFT